MSVNIKNLLSDLLQQALARVAPEFADTEIGLERPRQADHGDFSTNLALKLAKPLKANPRQIATSLLEALPPSDLLENAEIAGAGFINFKISAAAKRGVINEVLRQGKDYGRGAAVDEKILIEFVSANPTGPLHVGHGRGAAYGESLSSILEFAGYQVSREYYVNDAGRQMDILAISTWLRYLSLFHIEVPFPPNAYQGDYVMDMAKELRDVHGDRFAKVSAAQVLDGVHPLPEADRSDDEAGRLRETHLDALIASARKHLGEDYAWIHGFSANAQLSDGRDDLEGFGVLFDKWFSEKSLFDTGLIERACVILQERGFLYEQDGAKWFRSTEFGDSKDRVVQRENGHFTYFASDLGYHLNKFERGFDRLINVWGADHHGYIARLTGGIAAMGLPADQFHVALVQFVMLYRDGQKSSMSTRAGEFVTLRELREEVGRDACRYFFVSRKSDQHLDFDLDLAKSNSNDNPVFYIQYAHARICSVIKQWGGDKTDLGEPDLLKLEGEHENTLCKRLSQYPEFVQSAANDYAPHQIAFYLKDLAGDFHSWYNAERMLCDDDALQRARLALAWAVRDVLKSGLALLGVSAPESM